MLLWIKNVKVWYDLKNDFLLCLFNLIFIVNLYWFVGEFFEFCFVIINYVFFKIFLFNFEFVFMFVNEFILFLEFEILLVNL